MSNQSDVESANISESPFKVRRGRPKGLNDLTKIKKMLETMLSEVKRSSERITSLENKNNGSSDQEPACNVSSYNNFYNNSHRNIISSVNSVNLPKHNLPKFLGNLTEWNAFWQHFQHAVGTVAEHIISPINKLIYLKDCLSGSPLNMIKHLPLVHSSYNIAVQILEKEFANNSRVIKTLFDNLLSIKVCEDNLIDLRRFIDELSQILLQLISVTTVDVRNVLVIIQKKLPFWLVEKLVSFELENQEVITIYSVLECLRSAVRVKEHTQQFVSNCIESSVNYKINSSSKVNQQLFRSKFVSNNKPSLTFK